MTHAGQCILVTGGAGYVGGHVVRLLRRRGFAVVVLDNFSNASRKSVPDDVSVAEGSKGDKDLVSRTIDKYRPVAFVDLAGYPDIWEKKLTPAQFYENNVVETIRFVQTLLSAGVPNYLFSSSAMVYGVIKNEPVGESYPQAPTTVHGRSMRAAEDVVRDLLEGSGTRYVILRYFNAAGAMEDLSFGQTMPNYYHIITAALNVAFGVVQKVNAYGSDFDTPDGTGITDYVHVQDVADVHILAITTLLAGGASTVINCGYGHGHSVLEITNSVSRVSGKHIPTVFMERRGNFEGVAVLDNRKLTNEWGWRPRFDDLDTIVKHAYLWRKGLADGNKS